MGIANGANSGVSRGKYLDQLTLEEIQALCTWAIGAQGGPGERACGFEVGTMSVNTVDHCVTGFTGNTAHCQVALLEDCANSLHGDACQFLVSPGCKTYFECLVGQD